MTGPPVFQVGPQGGSETAVVELWCTGPPGERIFLTSARFLLADGTEVGSPCSSVGSRVLVRSAHSSCPYRGQRSQPGCELSLLAGEQFWEVGDVFFGAAEVRSGLGGVLSRGEPSVS